MVKSYRILALGLTLMSAVSALAIGVSGTYQTSTGSGKFEFSSSAGRPRYYTGTTIVGGTTLRGVLGYTNPRILNFGWYYPGTTTVAGSATVDLQASGAYAGTIEFRSATGLILDAGTITLNLK